MNDYVDMILIQPAEEKITFEEKLLIFKPPDD